MRSLELTLFGHRFLIFIKVKNSLKLFYCLINVARSLVFAIITLVLLSLSLSLSLSTDGSPNRWGLFRSWCKFRFCLHLFVRQTSEDKIRQTTFVLFGFKGMI